ncbi:MAG: zf-HC2 domain-containing protein [Fimbriimonadaceae bacterium]|nr:zf-HC2 domain-containing protein [Fimbriimonadaceae bacterium]
MSRRCLSCREAFERLDDFVDRELATGERVLVQEHLEVCAECARAFRFEEGVLRSLRAKIGRIDVPPELAARVREALDRASD